jgi:putative spermidine/putrescine transport system ATP-binding protein/spermidine/putrescine transport system ATP-binding protein
MKDPAIAMRGVEKRFGPVIAVKDVNLAVADGEFVALLGPSGCGKTTTLRMIAGLEQPTRGDILVKGRRVNDVPVHRRNFGMVFQNLALFPHKTAFENVAFGLHYRKVGKSEVVRRVQRALEIVRLPHVEDRLPAQLSGGQQQRIAVARAIVIEPDLLLFDEPLSALDAGLREDMRIELKRIQRTLGITTVFVTHDQSEALSMADRVVVLRDGRIEQEGAPDEVYNRPVSEFVARFFGQVNELAGTVAGTDGPYLVVRFEGGASVKVAAAGAAPGSSIRLLLRAERVQIGQRFPAEPGASIIPATVVASDYLGMLARYIVDAAGLRLAVLQPVTGGVLPNGAEVEVRIAADAWMAP